MNEHYFINITNNNVKIIIWPDYIILKERK